MFIAFLALSLASDKEKLLKEVTAMVSFQHPNVMTLVGVCFDGDVPLILMPYMSEGSVLRYVKENKSELLFDKEVNQDSEEVRMIPYYIPNFTDCPGTTKIKPVKRFKYIT